MWEGCFFELKDLSNFIEKELNKATEKKYTTIKNKLSNFEEYKKKKYYLRDVGPDFRNEFFKG
jgi:hypothetical protein